MPWYKKPGFQNAALILATIAIAYGLAVFEWRAGQSRL
jgi:hypothetical protein